MSLKNLDKIDLQLNVRTGKFYYIDGNGQFAEFSIPQSVQNGYTSYVANLAQSGTSAPVATVLYNDFDSEPVWGYNSAGDYKMTLTGAFPIDKTFVMVNSSEYGTNTTILFGASRFNDDQIRLETCNSFSPSNDLIGMPLSIEVRVYN